MLYGHFTADHSQNIISNPILYDWYNLSVMDMDTCYLLFSAHIRMRFNAVGEPKGRGLLIILCTFLHFHTPQGLLCIARCFDWIKRSSKLPFPIVSTRLIRNPHVEHLAEALTSVENQARIAKSWVEIGNFDHQCHAATHQLSHLHRHYIHLLEGLISANERLHHCSKLSSQLVDLLSLLMFEQVSVLLLTNLNSPLHQHLSLPPLYPLTVTSWLSGAHCWIELKWVPE